jgi:hypothetical protein
MKEKISNAETIESNATTESGGEEPKEWTVLVYLGGENNLFDEMVFAIKAMKSSIEPPEQGNQNNPETEFNFHALVQFAAEEASNPSSTPKPPIRLILTPGDIDGMLKKNLVKAPPTDDLGQSQKPYATNDYEKELIEFLVWGITTGRARHYLLIFSGHGLGIESDFLSKDSTPVQSLTVKEFGRILRDPCVKDALALMPGRTIDILGLDSCLMNMAEVGYELRNEVSIMIASQGSESNLGWPYKSIFKRLHSHPGAAPEDLAKNIVDKFVAYYDDFACVANNSADVSACRLHAYMDELKNEVDGLATALLKHMELEYGKYDKKSRKWDPGGSEFARSLIFAHWYAQTYHFDQYADIQDLCDVLGENLPDDDYYEDVRRRCKRVIEAVSACVIYPEARRYTGPLYQYSNGISIYFPWSDIYKPYSTNVEEEKLDFLKDGAWLGFIKAYVNFTRRPPKLKDRDWKYIDFGTKDSPPHSKGVDDPSTRAKNPPSIWGAPTYVCEDKP